MAGSNVPSLNALLQPYHIAFGQGVYSGNFKLSDQQRITMQSSSEIIKFPKGGYLISAKLSEQVPAYPDAP
jgi:membrane-bound transcription factor site-1 protease